jgi:2,3-dihydroxybiphenyl 1,2-dioxygenase
MNNVAVTELGYVGVGIRDIDAWRFLVSDIFGMEWVAENDKIKLRMDNWHNRVILHPGQEEDLLYAGFRVAGIEEFRMMREHLTACNVSFEVASPAEAGERCVLELLRLKDPAGVPLEIFHGPRVDRHRPFRPGRGMHGKFCTGPGGLGHVGIRVVDAAQSYRFYSQVLGMRGGVETITQFGPQIVTPTFMDCNTRDHTVAFSPVPIENSIHHLMVEVDNIDDVGLAYDMIQKRGIPVLATIGRHSNDSMISFYIQSPSGWALEYGCSSSPAKSQSEYNVSEVWGHEFHFPAGK